MISFSIHCTSQFRLFLLIKLQKFNHYHFFERCLCLLIIFPAMTRKPRQWCLQPSWEQDFWYIEGIMYITWWLEAGFHNEIKNTDFQRTGLQECSTLSNSFVQRNWWDSRRNIFYYFSKGINCGQLSWSQISSQRGKTHLLYVKYPAKSTYMWENNSQTKNYSEE